MAFGVGRTPRTIPRVRRNWGKMTKDNGITDGLAIQIGGDGKITLVIASGEPFTQSTAGLALTVSASSLLSKTSSSLLFDDDEVYSQMAHYAGIAH